MQRTTVLGVLAATVLWALGIALSVLVLFSTSGGCTTGNGGGGTGCTFLGLQGPDLLAAGFGCMVLGLGVISRLPLSRPRRSGSASGTVPSQGVVHPLPGGLGVWIPSDRASQMRLPPSSKGRSAPRRPGGGRTTRASGPREGFAPYSAANGSLVGLPGGLGVLVPTPYTRTPPSSSKRKGRSTAATKKGRASRRGGPRPPSRPPGS